MPASHPILRSMCCMIRREATSVCGPGRPNRAHPADSWLHPMKRRTRPGENDMAIRQGCLVLLAGLAALPAWAQTPSPALTGVPLRIKQFRSDIVVDSEGRSESTITNTIQMLKILPGMPVGQLPVSYNATLEEVEISDAYTQ